MALSCPNKSLPEWKRLVDEVGEREALNDYFQFGTIRSPYAVKDKLERLNIANYTNRNFKIGERYFKPTVESLIDVEKNSSVVDAMVTHFGYHGLQSEEDLIKRKFTDDIRPVETVLTQPTTTTTKSQITEPVSELFESNPKLANAVYETAGFRNVITPNDKIVWGHPAIGKTTMLESNPNAFIDWDNEFNRKRDNWIASKSNTTIGTPEFKKARNEYMINYNNHKDYVAFVKEEWNKAKEKTNKENKTLIASPHMLLNLFPNDFDKVITMSDKTFMDRAIKRSSGDEVNSKLWKEGINKTLQSVDKSKIIETDKFINDLFITPQQAQQLYSSYLQTTNNPTIEGFKQWNNRQQQVNELFESNPKLANEVYEALGFKKQQYVSKLKEITERRKLATKSDLENSQLIKDLRVDKSQPKELKPNAADNNLAAIMLYGMKMSELEDKGLSEEMMEATTLAYRILNDFMFDMDELSFYEDILLENPEYASRLSTNENPVKEFFENDIFEQADKEKFKITPEQKQQAQQLYQSFLDIYLQDFLTTDGYYALEEVLVINKIIDRKCN